jgi:hypothetical protein
LDIGGSVAFCYTTLNIEQSVALVGFHGFFVEKNHKNPDKGAARKLRFLGSFRLAVCKVKNRLFRRFLEVLCTKRNKLLGGVFIEDVETLYFSLYSSQPLNPQCVDK